MTAYVVATTKPWNLAAIERHVPAWPGEWHVWQSPDDLTLERLRAVQPRYVFLPHWSWRVPKAIVDAYECVCFHMTDVPYGRGGSPLQNLLVRDHRTTRMTALRMVETLDAGPVYAKEPLDLGGSAQEIFERATDLIARMIATIVRDEPVAVPQEGDPVVFPRRTPDQSRLPEDPDLRLLYNTIRMLDAETYPRAFVDHGPFRLEMSDASLQDDAVEAKVRIRLRQPGHPED